MIPLSELKQVLDMGEELGLAHARKRWPDISKEEIEGLRNSPRWRMARESSAAQQAKQTGGNYDPHQPLCVTVLWLLGGSLRQISRMYDVTPQTIMNKIDRVMRHTMDRTAERLVMPPVSPEELAINRTKFYAILDQVRHAFDGMTPQQAAIAVQAMPTELKPDEPQPDDPYGDLPDTERRVGEATA